jgi:hypothetical protein
MAKRKKEREKKNTVECYYCGKPVSPGALRCPHCGRWYRDGKIAIALVVILLVSLPLIAFFSIPQSSGGGGGNGGETVTYYVQEGDRISINYMATHSTIADNPEDRGKVFDTNMWSVVKDDRNYSKASDFVNKTEDQCIPLKIYIGDRNPTPRDGYTTVPYWKQLVGWWFTVYPDGRTLGQTETINIKDDSGRVVALYQIEIVSFDSIPEP